MDSHAPKCVSLYIVNISQRDLPGVMEKEEMWPMPMEYYSAMKGVLTLACVGELANYSEIKEARRKGHLS